jgi:hypothetical protein
MEDRRDKWLHELTGQVLPGPLHDLEYRFPRFYENKLLELARAHGTKVVFLYTPQYDGPQNPPPYGLYSSRAELINPWPAVQDYRLWYDVNHLNWEGAKHMTDYVADVLSTRSELK